MAQNEIDSEAETSTTNERNDTDNEDDTISENGRPASPIENPRLIQRRRLIETPIDQSLIGKYVFNTREIKIQQLLNEEVESELNLGRMHLTIQLLRIITPQQGNTGNAFTRYQRGNAQQKINFIRIFLCRSHGRLCYIMMTNDMNKRIFHRDLMLRDNGTITIGSFFRLLAPYPIERNMQGIPLVRSHYPIVALEYPSDLMSIPINTYIQANQASFAILKNVNVEVRRTTPIQTTCSGKHCDKQRPMDWSNTVNRGCGCWGTSNLGTSNIALMHNLIIEDNLGNRFRMDNFSSTKFNFLFMDKPIPPNTTIAALEQTEATLRLEEAIERCIECINRHQGFQVTLWYSRGEINDRSLIGLNTTEDEAQVDAGKMSYHVVEVKAMHENFDHEITALGMTLKNMKFNVGENL